MLVIESSQVARRQRLARRAERAPTEALPGAPGPGNLSQCAIGFGPLSFWAQLRLVGGGSGDATRRARLYASGARAHWGRSGIGRSVDPGQCQARRDAAPNSGRAPPKQEAHRFKFQLLPSCSLGAPTPCLAWTGGGAPAGHDSGAS